MRLPSWRKVLRGASLRRDFDEIKGLVIRYVKEETVQPLKDVARYAAFGAIGSVFVGFGSLMLLIGLLRFLQQFRVLDGSLSWLPYLIVAVVSIAVLALTAWRIVADTSVRRRLKGKS